MQNFLKVSCISLEIIEFFKNQSNVDDYHFWLRIGEFQVGEVDVTVNPGLSGRFLVTALPTIYQ